MRPKNVSLMCLVVESLLISFSIFFTRGRIKKKMRRNRESRKREFLGKQGGEGGIIDDVVTHLPRTLEMMWIQRSRGLYSDSLHCARMMNKEMSVINLFQIQYSSVVVAINFALPLLLCFFFFFFLLLLFLLLLVHRVLVLVLVLLLPLLLLLFGVFTFESELSL
ncbi:hypothetical protein NMG60_11028275 [Bertholletia excelsa]